MSGRRTAYTMVNQARQVAERFSVGDRVSICYAQDSFPGIVTKVEAEIGKVWVDFAGNVKQMDPFEIRHDTMDVVPIHDEEAFTVTPVKEPEASVKRREAIYHFQPGRNYKLTRQEQNGGTANCPRCHAEMTSAPFARGIQLYECPDCDFRITTDHVFDAEYKSPEQNDNEFPIPVDENGNAVSPSEEEPMDVMIAKKLCKAGGEQIVYELVQQLAQTQTAIADLLDSAGKDYDELASQAGRIEKQLFKLIRGGQFGLSAYEALKKFKVNTGEMGSTLINAIEASLQKNVTTTIKSIYPPPWPIRKPQYSVLTASAKTRTAAAGPYTLLQQLQQAKERGNIDDDQQLLLIGQGWGYTRGADYIFGEAGEEIVSALINCAAGRLNEDKTRTIIRKNLNQALLDNEPFKGLRGEQRETHDLWMQLMDQRRKGLME